MWEFCSLKHLTNLASFYTDFAYEEYMGVTNCYAASDETSLWCVLQQVLQHKNTKSKQT